MHGVGDDADLRAGEAHRVDSDVVQRHAQERHADALAGREQHVHLATRRIRRHLVRELQEVVGGLAHRRNDDHQIVPRSPRGGNMAGDIAHPLGVGDRCSAVLLHDERHACNHAIRATTCATDTAMRAR